MGPHSRALSKETAPPPLTRPSFDLLLKQNLYLRKELQNVAKAIDSYHMKKQREKDEESFQNQDFNGSHLLP